MSDKEIKEFNNKYLKVEEMYYCPKCDKEHHDILCPFCDSNLKNVEIKDCPVEIANDIWNAAIEDTAKCVEQANRDGPYQAIVSHREIRKLKK